MRSSLIMAYLGVAVAVLAGGSAIAQLPPADGLDHPECIESCRRTTESDAGGTNHYILHCEDGCWEAMAADIGQVAGITVDAFGQVYFSNQTMVYELSHGAVRRIAGNGIAGYAGDGGRAIDASLDMPLRYPEMDRDFIDYSPLVGGLAVDGEGAVYIADAYNNRVRRVSLDGTIATVLGGGATPFGWPQGLAFDARGNLYVSSAWGYLVRIAPDGATSALEQADCGPDFRDGGLCSPEQIAVDHAGNVYVPDGYCRVRKVAPDGSVMTVAGDERPDGRGFAFTCDYSGDGGPAVGAALSNAPYGVAVDDAGNLYIADTSNHCIRKVDTEGMITTFAGRCQVPGYAGDGGPATWAYLNSPYGVAVDGAGNVYIADTLNRRVRRVSPDGTIETVAGNGG
jgi:DNA-binding beta-propeller fold protein YncE